MIMARSRQVTALATGMIFAWTVNLCANDGLSAHRYLKGEPTPTLRMNPDLRENRRSLTNPLRASSVISIPDSGDFHQEHPFHDTNVARILLGKPQTDLASQTPEARRVDTSARQRVPIINATYRMDSIREPSGKQSFSSCPWESFFADRHSATTLSSSTFDWITRSSSQAIMNSARRVCGTVLPLVPSFQRMKQGMVDHMAETADWFLTDFEDQLTIAARQREQDRLCTRELQRVAREESASNTQVFVFDDALTLDQSLLVDHSPFSSHQDAFELIESFQNKSAVPVMLASNRARFIEPMMEPESIQPAMPRLSSLGRLFGGLKSNTYSALQQLSYWALEIAHRAEVFYEGLENLLFGKPLGKIWDRVLQWEEAEPAIVLGPI